MHVRSNPLFLSTISSAPMETSSPLASLQPNVHAPFSRHYDVTDFSSNFLRPCPNDVSNFNFRDMSMIGARKDYFALEPVRGSSPTASLAADLSQNFNIEKSPALPTPRRNLFAKNNLFGLNEQRDRATPPIPSSSPYQDGSSAMDISPLPHKPPFSPNPADSSDPIEESNSIPPKQIENSRPNSGQSFPHSRRISNAARPSLRKGYSLNAFDGRPNSTQSTNPPPFVFGPGSKPSKPLLEAFVESPPSEKKPAPVDSASKQNAPPLPKLVFPHNGSPMGGVRRMSSARPSGPQRQGLGRRTQSLQCNNEPFRPMRSEKRTCTDGLLRSPTMEVDETHEPKLPHHTSNDEVDSLPRITTETLVDLMNGAHNDMVETPTIIDCRFEYEFHGGHIEGAINYNDKELLATKLFEEIPSNSTSRPLIFHCEYSAHRAPLMAAFIRQKDRAVNQDRYPYLTYPEIYLLEGGYSVFFTSYQNLCYPQNYVEMDDKNHEQACEIGMAKVKRRAKLSRAQTYAFGQNLSANTSSCAVVRSSTHENGSKSADAAFAPLPPFDELASSRGFDDTFPSHDRMAMDIDFSSPVAFESPIPPTMGTRPHAGSSRMSLSRRLDSYGL